MATIGSQKPSNLVHIVLDNESYQSTGGQPTVSKKISFERTAKISGYRNIVKIISKDLLKKNIKKYFYKKGPVFILIKVYKKGIDDIGRVTHKPTKIKSRFMKTIQG